MSALPLALLLAAAPWDAPPSFAPRWLSAARPTEVTRVVTVAPSVTELLYALGKGGLVVGVSRYDDFPEAATKLPKVGGFLDPNPEAILALRPSLVIAAPNASNRAPLERVAALGVPVLVLPGNGFSDLFVAIDEIAAITGTKAQASLLSAALRSRLSALAERAKAQPTLRALVVIGYQPLIVAGPGSFADTALAILGAKNVVEVDAPYPQLSAEEVMKRAPDVVIDAAGIHGGERPLGPAFEKLRVVSFAESSLLRPGPRLVDAMEALERLLREAP